MYVFAPNQTVAVYPYSFAELRAAHSQVSFPSPMSDEELVNWGVFSVLTTAPGNDPITENAVELEPRLVNGLWVQQWLIEPASAEQIMQRRRAAADYHAFWEVLISSSLYGSIREQAMTSLPMNTLATEFIALIGDAKAGRANEAAIQQSMDAILATGTFTEEQLVELQGALEAGNLESIYTLPAA